ncbi:unnamed protein product [marine sediment metagenome]|uniref:Inositol monophosphatase n=1 Tax=marine sediment metagenome TaxID=412755 RepID=X0T1B0_9ZZZZ
MIDLKEALDFAEKLALKAGKFLLENQKKVKIKKYKDRQDIQTNIDLQVEKIIISAIQKKYPKHNIDSEEKGLIDKNSDYTWIIDPLDGTKEYFRRIPNYNTSFCLFLNKKPISSIVYLPYSNQLFSAADGKGAFLNDKKIHVNNKRNLKNSIIYLFPPCFEVVNNKVFKNNFKKIKKLTEKVYRARYHQRQNSFLSFLALGSTEAYINFSFPSAIEDFAPGLFIAKMAGAKITDLKGKKLDFSKSGQLYIASNAKIHDQLIKILNQ